MTIVTDVMVCTRPFARVVVLRTTLVCEGPLEMRVDSAAGFVVDAGEFELVGEEANADGEADGEAFGELCEECLVVVRAVEAPGRVDGVETTTAGELLLADGMMPTGLVAVCFCDGDADRGADGEAAGVEERDPTGDRGVEEGVGFGEVVLMMTTVDGVGFSVTMLVVGGDEGVTMVVGGLEAGAAELEGCLSTGLVVVLSDCLLATATMLVARAGSEWWITTAASRSS
ncbi:MAG: hypothetical protein ACRYGG_13185 [Janthinobacterium lividum]